MKILWINPAYMGYREAYYNELGKKVELIVARSSKRGGDENLNPEFFTVKSFRERIIEIPKIGFKKNEELSNRFFRLTFSIDRYGLLLAVRPDIVIVEGIPFSAIFIILFASIFEIPVYLTNERTLHTERNQGLKFYYRKFVLGFVEGLLVNGKASKDYILDLKPSFSNFIEGQLSNNYPNLDCITRNTHNDQVTQWLFVGKLNYRKGFSILLDTWQKWVSRFPSHKLTVVGANADNYTLDNVPGLNYLGVIDENLMPGVYQKSDVLIMPTLEDNWSMTVVEALSEGCRVISTYQNGNSVEFGGLSVVQIYDANSENGLLNSMESTHEFLQMEFPVESVNDLLSYYSHEKAVERLLKGIC